MQENIPTTKIILLKNIKADGTYPLKLRITFLRIQRFFPCNIDLTQEDFTKIFTTVKLKKNEKILKETIQAIEIKAQEIIAKMSVFSFELFAKKFYDEPEEALSTTDIYAVLKELSESKESLSAINTGTAFKASLASFKTYRAELQYLDVTADFLRHYEHFMIAKGRSLTTVGFYLRDLRTAFNIGIARNFVDRKDYPFSGKGYVIPTGNSIKKALKMTELEKMFSYPVKQTGGWEEKAKDFWCLSYLANGMNMNDILKLKHKDIYDGEIHYERAKNLNKNRGKSNTVIYVPLLPETIAIINKYSVPAKTPNDYIFDVITHEMTPARIVQKVAQFIQNVNKYNKKMATALGFDKELTTYVARHSFATVLKRSGASIEAIAENLGHRNTNTTKHYLDSFESESRLERSKALVAFSAKKDDLSDSTVSS